MGAAGAAPVAPVSEYQKAVDAYVTAAGNELQALKGQADAGFKAAPEHQRKNYEAFYAAYEKCAATFARLKTASPKDFDALKAAYEQQRLETAKALGSLGK